MYISLFFLTLKSFSWYSCKVWFIICWILLSLIYCEQESITVMSYTYVLKYTDKKPHECWARATVGISWIGCNCTCGLPSFILEGCKWGSSLLVLVERQWQLPLTRHQCSIHYISSSVAKGAIKRRWARQTFCDTDTSKLVQREYNEAELNFATVFWPKGTHKFFC